MIKNSQRRILTVGSQLFPMESNRVRENAADKACFLELPGYGKNIGAFPSEDSEAINPKAVAILQRALALECFQILCGSHLPGHRQLGDAVGIRFKTGADPTRKTIGQKAVFPHQFASRFVCVQINQYSAQIENDRLDTAEFCHPTETIKTSTREGQR